MTNVRRAPDRLARMLEKVFAELKATVPSWQYWESVPVTERDTHRKRLMYRRYLRRSGRLRPQDNDRQGP